MRVIHISLHSLRGVTGLLTNGARQAFRILLQSLVMKLPIIL
jgi:hypothetical protein